MPNRKRFTEPEEVALLEEIVSEAISGTVSYRNGAQRLRDATGKAFSHEALRKIVNKRKAEMDEQRDSERLGD